MQTGVAIKKYVDIYHYNTCLAKTASVAATCLYTLEGGSETGKVEVCVAYSETVGEWGRLNAYWFGFQHPAVTGAGEQTVQMAACHLCHIVPVAVAA